MSKKLVYSHLPRQSYSIMDGNKPYGIGVHPVLDVVEGAWNLMYLAAGAVLDGLLAYEGPVSHYPTEIACFPACVGTALQLTGRGLETWNDLLLSVPPKEVIARMKIANMTPMIVLQYSLSVYNIMAGNAIKYMPGMENIIHVDFSKVRVQ